MTALKDQIKARTYGEYGPSLGRTIALQLLATGISVLSLFLVLVNILYTRSISTKEFPTLVQSTSGEVLEIEFQEPGYRSPETIKKFVGDTLYYLMTMTSYGPAERQVSMLDPSRPKVVGTKVGNGQITQSAWIASESLSGSFADAFREQLAAMTPATVFSGNEEVILKYRSISEPVEILDDAGNPTGSWIVDVVADLKVFKTTSTIGEIATDTVPFNKRVTVVRVDPVEMADVSEFGQLAMMIQQTRKAGLEIKNIQDI